MSRSPIPLWRRLVSGDVAPGWLGRGTGRDQPETARQDQDGSDPDRELVLRRVHDDGVSRSAMPDRPYHDETAPGDRDEKPLVPAGWYQPGDTVRFWARRTGRIAAFHAVRVPLYLGQNAMWAPRGAGRILVGAARWVQVHDQRDVEWSAADHAVRYQDYGPYERISKARRDQTKTRLLVVLAGAAGLVAGLVTAVSNPVLLVSAVLAGTVGLGFAGRPMDRPYIESAVVSEPGARRITPDMIVTALHSAKLCKEVLGPDAPEFVAPGVHRDGKGYAAVIDLPHGYTAQQAIDRKTQIAAGLRVDEFRLFIWQERGDRGHAGQIRMWISDDNPHTRPPKPSPLVQASKFDLWQPVPFGVDERGDQVAFPLVWTSVLIGAMPRMGKSNAMRLLLSSAALDAHVKLLVWDGKGGKDLAALDEVAHAFGAGEDDDVAEALVAVLADLQTEMRDRFKRLRKLPDEMCPEGKLTPGLARDPKANMPLTVVALDEFQVYLGNRLHGKRIEELVTSLAKIGPAAGIILVMSTQRPSAKTMPTDLRDVIGTRFGMSVPSRESSEMILGSGSYKAGLDASKFLKHHKGIGILLGADDGPLADKGGQTVHAHVMDLVEFRQVCARGRALREGAGTLTGVAAGDEPEHLSDRILEHVLAAFRGEDKAHSDVLIHRLAQTHPGLYELWDQADLAAALSRYGIATGNQTWAPSLEDDEPRNRKGFRRQQIIDAMVARSGGVPDTPPDLSGPFDPPDDA